MLSIHHPRRRRMRRPSRGGGFSPAQLVGVVGAWYRNSTVGLIASLPDVLGGSAAANGTPANQPTGGADFSMSFDASDGLLVTLSAAGTGNNGDTYFGFGFWIKPSLSSTGVVCSATTFSGASTNKFEMQSEPTGSASLPFLPSGSCSMSVGSLVAGVAAFVSFEFNGPRAAGLRGKWFVNGIDRTATDSMAATMATPTGTMCLGGRDGSGSSGAPEIFGRNWYVYRAPMVGATSGLLTTEARSALQNFEGLL